MIASVINIPERKRSIIVIVIEPDNLERMSKGDPATLESRSLGGIMPRIDFPENYAVLVAYELDEVELYKKARAGELLGYLERGRRFIKGLDGAENSCKISGSPGDSNWLTAGDE